MELAPHQEIAAQLFSERLTESNIDADVYSEYVVSILLENDITESDCQAEDAIDPAVEALSAVTDDEELALCLVKELYRNLCDTSLTHANSGLPSHGTASQEAMADDDTVTADVSHGDNNCANGSGRTVGIGSAALPAPLESTGAIASDNGAQFDQELTDVNEGIADFAWDGGDYSEHSESDMSTGLDDDAALADYLADSNHQLWLSDYESEAEQSIFDLLNFDYSRTQGVESVRDATPMSSGQSSSGPGACIFFLSGSCLKADCQFSHDATATVCRFWASGCCLKGDACPFAHEERSHAVAAPACKFWASGGCWKGDDCPFSHEESPSSVAAAAEVPSVPEEREVCLSADDFPSLSSTPGDASSTAASLPLTSGQWSHTVKSGTRTTAAAGSDKRATATATGALAKAKAADQGAHSIEWVPVGESLSQQYEEIRHQAIAHGSSRNKCFQQATAAYRAGDKASATRFSRQGRHHDQQMRRLHEKAEAEIFCIRNEKLEENIIDVHGLHVEEAVSRVSQFLSQLEASRPVRNSSHAYIITGTGHHSVRTGYKAQLQPVIVEHVQSRRLAIVDCSKDGRGGLLRVTIPPKKL